MEELELTDPVVKESLRWRVVALTLQQEDLAGLNAGLVLIHLRDNNDILRSHQYTGQTALDYIKYINTANFTTTSLHKRILQRLSTEGVLPGTVVGAPDTVTGEL